MTTGQLPSHIQAANELLGNENYEEALCEAELASDECWKFGDVEITQALPLLSMLRHATGVKGNVFESLDDLPTSFSDALFEEAKLLNEQHDSQASKLMLEDVANFIDRWIGEEPAVRPVSSHDQNNDDKVETLIAEIRQFSSAGKHDHAVEASLQLANEYVVRGNHHRAFRMFRRVLRKAKRDGRSRIRMDALIDFGQFLGELENYKDALYALRLAAKVAKKSRDKERFAQAAARLGIVSMHAGQLNDAIGYLKKAHAMLNPWDLEANIVKEHLESVLDHDSTDGAESAKAASGSNLSWK